jgi:hypothetical protein
MDSDTQKLVNDYFGWFQGALSGLSDLIKKFTEMMKAFIESWKKRFVFTKYTGGDADNFDV